ncbi:uncharacterized protein Hap1MRO34_022097 isoform 2-T4 [Clarias gariepinus]|uniref:C-type lectin domain family 4 member M-like n=1 Tax=Clarias gariepinus TaxID=13013 RepID=UPI00234CF21A|nr:C-type lectin domain family 4 member M-like [Clarias gariepinus]
MSWCSSKRMRDRTIADDDEGHDPEEEDTDAETHPEAQHTGGDTAWSWCYRVTAVCAVLLCVLLLAAVTVLWIKFNILNTEYSQLHINNLNLTIERCQLQTSYNNLTIGRNQLQTSYNKLTIKRNQLQTSYNKLTRERDQLQTSYNKLTRERDQLQTSYNKLTIERDQLQTSYINLTIEKCQLQEERTLCDLTKGKCFIFSSSLYFMSNEIKSWTESRQDCRDKGADLVIINSREEQEFISKQKVNGQIYVWIGLSDRETEGEWKWVDGTPLNTVFWASGEPNNIHGDEDCVVIYSDDSGNFWNDNKCSVKLNWICEKHISQ